MSDKFRQTYPIAITFTRGELPTAEKLQSIASQARNGQTLIQHALGDLWNQSSDALLTADDVSDNALMIPNLARYLGATKLSNPRIPALSAITQYTHKFTNDGGNNDATLAFPPAGGTTYTWGGGSSNSATPKASLGLVVAANDWYIDTETGYVYSFTPFNAAYTLTYDPQVDGDVGSSTTYNVIPDPDTDTAYNYRGLKICYKNGTDNSEGYYVFLPPRMPLDTRETERAPDKSLSANFSSSPGSTPVLFWHSHTTDATTGTYGEHYRYVLPTIITGSSAWAQGASLPQGLLYLWDHSDTGTILEGLTYFADDAATPVKYKMIVRGSALDSYLSSDAGVAAYPPSALTATSNHAYTYYPANGLRLITVGSDLSALVSSLLEQFLNHDHGSSNSMPSRIIKHSKLSNLFDPDETTPQLDPSTLTNDGHPQYLHRQGLNVSARDKFQNSMLGDLLMASSGSTSNYLNFSSDSRRILFGQNDLSNCGMIRTDIGTGRMVLHCRSSSVGAGGILIGDPDSYASSTLLVAAYNTAFTIRPNDSTGTLTIGTSNTGFDMVISAGGGLDLRAGNDISSTGPSSEQIVLRGEAGIALRAGNNAGTAAVDLDLIADRDCDVSADKLELTRSGSYIAIASASKTWTAALHPMTQLSATLVDNIDDDSGDHDAALVGVFADATEWAMVPWTANGSSSMYFENNPSGDTGLIFSRADMLCIVDDFPSCTITRIEIDWQPSDSGSDFCSISKRTHAGSETSLGTITSNTTSRTQQALTGSFTFDKSDEILCLHFNSATISDTSTWIVYPTVQITATLTKLIKYLA